MNMSEINNIKVNGQTGVDSSRNISSRDDRGNDKSSPVSASETRPDTVSLTNTATQLQSLQQTLSEVPEVDSGRVEAIRAAIADGSYSVDVNELAQNLIEFEQQLN
jgi:negative regulator of flagellin synthesis FlgM